MVGSSSTYPSYLNKCVKELRGVLVALIDYKSHLDNKSKM